MAHISRAEYNQGSIGEAADAACKTFATFAVATALALLANRLRTTTDWWAAAPPVRAAAAFLWGPNPNRNRNPNPNPNPNPNRNPNPNQVRAAAAFLWGGAVLRAFMIFHDAGHGSFVRGSRFGRWLNWASKHVFAAGCATPTDW